MIVASVLGAGSAQVNLAVSALAERFGRLAYVSPPLEFAWTDYYSDELGSAPSRRFVALDQPTDPGRLPALKRTASRLEVALARPGAPRAVNIDPAILNESQLVVASTKPRAHRVYLGEGVYGDLMLLWRGGGFVPLEWTYPDYAVEETRDIFNRLRSLHLARRRGDGPETRRENPEEHNR